MREKTLQAAICASNLGIGREFTGEMAQIDCSGIHHSQNQKHIVSRRLLLKGKCGDNLAWRVVRALVNISWTLFSDKSPSVNHDLDP